MNTLLGHALVLIGLLQISFNSAWLANSMLWSAGGFCAGVGVGYLIRLAQERLGRRTNDDHT